MEIRKFPWVDPSAIDEATERVCEVLSDMTDCGIEACIVASAIQAVTMETTGVLVVDSAVYEAIDSDDSDIDVYVVDADE